MGKYRIVTVDKYKGDMHLITFYSCREGNFILEYTCHLVEN